MATSGIIKQQPANLNNLPGNKFQVVFKRLPNVRFFCQTVIIPSASISEALMPNPFVDFQIPGEKLTFSTLDISFTVDENLNNYNEVYNWMRGLGFPEKFDEFANLIKGDGEFSDASVLVLNNNMNPVLEIEFNDCWPTTLGSLIFTSQVTTVDPVSIDASFYFKGSFKINKII